MGMGILLRFPRKRRHARAPSSNGYKSGRNSRRETPDTRSTASTRSGGTSSHCETACAVIPIRRANSACPPEFSIARLRAAALSLMANNSSIALPESQALLHCLSKVTLYDIEMTLGKSIKAARERLRPKMTQGDLGNHFNISDKAVSGWERNDSIPEVDKIAEIARVLKVPANWLLEGKGPPPPPEALESVLDRLNPADRALLEAMAQTLLQQRTTAA